MKFSADIATLAEQSNCFVCGDFDCSCARPDLSSAPQCAICNLFLGECHRVDRLQAREAGLPIVLTEFVPAGDGWVCRTRCPASFLQYVSSRPEITAELEMVWGLAMRMHRLCSARSRTWFGNLALHIDQLVKERRATHMQMLYLETLNVRTVELDIWIGRHLANFELSKIGALREVGKLITRRAAAMTFALKLPFFNFKTCPICLNKDLYCCCETHCLGCLKYFRECSCTLPLHCRGCLIPYTDCACREHLVPVTPECEGCNRRVSCCICWAPEKIECTACGAASGLRLHDKAAWDMNFGEEVYTNEKFNGILLCKTGCTGEEGLEQLALQGLCMSSTPRSSAREHACRMLGRPLPQEEAQPACAGCLHRLDACECPEPITCLNCPGACTCWLPDHISCIGCLQTDADKLSINGTLYDAANDAAANPLLETDRLIVCREACTGPAKSRIRMERLSALPGWLGLRITYLLEVSGYPI